MRILICEDDDQKYADISDVIVSFGVSENSITRARSLNAITKALRNSYDLYIIDFMLPYVDGGDNHMVAAEVLREIDEIGGFRTKALAITNFFDDTSEQHKEYHKRNCNIFRYSDVDIWTTALQLIIDGIEDRGRYEFIIITSVEVEQKAYLKVRDAEPKRVFLSGMDVLEIEFRGIRGAVVLLPRMGLVNVSIYTTKILSEYTPKVICMSGICGGVGEDVQMGQLLITELCFEYQSGKWFDDIFKSEPYQFQVEENTVMKLKEIVASERYIENIEAEIVGEFRPELVSKAKTAVFATGSAVIASKERLDHIREQHRKVQAIDMEIYGFHRAVKLCNPDMKNFSAKTVVDKADTQKNNDIQLYGSYISARFCLDAIFALHQE